MNNCLLDGISVNYHASIRIKKDDFVIYFDPYKISDELSLNDADYIFITHGHYDHFSIEDIKKVKRDNTKFVAPFDLKEKIIDIGVLESNIMLVKPGKSYEFGSVSFDVIASYNINKNYHKKEYNWAGYNVLLGGVKYYVIGDSDVISEMDNVHTNVLFAPVGGTYTMDYNTAASLTNKLKPEYAIPIHYGEVGSINDANKFIENLEDGIKGVIISN